MSILNNIKTIALAGLIAIGLIVQASPSSAAGTETLTVAGGCFWCVEADFEKVKGVKGAVSGFAGGKTANPTYKQVTAGGTGHYEAVQITFDPALISAGQLLDLFFRSVDPTDAGGQFCDRGPSYRTAIFATGSQMSAAEQAKTKAQADLGKKVVTPILSAGKFYPADAYHQNYAKSSKIILTRFGPKSKANAYKAYRKSCGRDRRVKELWGSAAPFAG
ncbi:peptide-methionine (S)-S-oxide reductase MsrA [uncultured Sulfitobacter sp.]|uniref:peptide-methionine (S)-S-oxide reductase MsrA n=1 Tax=uncultured Sulfitobacter sp. TaxID=191468 RepID=UPI00260D9EF8|nr:peptide-methionine (S)-S-oxide reductase MsrA [uncultured Sulfitobacter sp.]